MKSRWIDLTDVTAPRLIFKSWSVTEDTGTSWDRKIVQVSTDGTNWVNVTQIYGPNAQWTTQDVDIGAYAGKLVRVRFFLDTIDAINNAFEG